MSSLFNKFVKHYTSVSAQIQVRKKYENSWLNIDRGNEVQAIKKFLLDRDVGVDYLNKNVSPALSIGDFYVKFASVFCHKKPLVRRTDRNLALYPSKRKGCELGDLFVLFVLLDNDDKLHYAAGALFQAKLKPKLDSLTQKYLYDVDPDFEVPKYLENRILPPQKLRQLPTYEEGRGRAFRYLILKPGFSKINVSARHTPWENNYQRHWSTFLDGLMSGIDGLITEPSSKSPSSWDTIVADLLTVGRSITGKNSPRGNDVAVQVATSLFNNFRNLDDYSAETKALGVPTLIVIVHAHNHFEKVGDKKST